MVRSSRSRPCLHSVRCRRLRSPRRRSGSARCCRSPAPGRRWATRAGPRSRVKRLNHQLKNAHVTLDIVDTGQDPDRAKAGFDKLAGVGVKLIIGPQSSSEVAVIMGAANQAVAQQVAKAGGDTAVYLAGFEEVADVLAAAGSVQGLDQATWYGGDGSAQAKQLVDDAQTVAFAEKTGSFPSPLVALPKGAENRHHALLKQITRRARATVDAFGLAAYDAVQVGVRALVAADTNADAAADRKSVV